MERNRQYNLLSDKHGSIQVPVEIQLCNDRKFLESLLNPVETVNQESDQNSSISELSELDCLVLLDMSDSSGKSEKDSDPEKINACGAGSQQAGTSSKDDCSAEILINQEILSQLHQITQRSDKLKDGSKCKKTSDPTKLKTKVIKVVPAAPSNRHNNSS